MTSLTASALVLVFLLALQSPVAAAFAPPPPWGGVLATRSTSTTTVQTNKNQHSSAVLFSVTKNGDAETEVEKLMRMARELRAEAEVAEQEVHQKLLSKKEERQAETDRLMADLFDSDSDSLLVERLREKRYSTDTLLRMIDRLYEREIAAKGFERVESSHDSTNPVQFHRVNEGSDNTNSDDTTSMVVVDQQELDRILTWADSLLKATEVLDDDFRHDKETNNDHSLSYAEHEHWNPGECSVILRHKLQELRREHDEQFQNRQQEFYDAQRRKDLPPPPDKKKVGRK
eukprot:CAMPEP_0119007446 /NCGR_PEP_ID=MMETSP1176-20130426/3017_1 /TAXON_ID=265551 /ORGANISM="Synedropsis recta cf, Strain CCMP1620" /LENGTH=287 /DNA_ID=CAMNT_0006959601 /DNA_START=15 /DNA_END=878 /DNA_ORIENTATION=-